MNHGSVDMEGMKMKIKLKPKKEEKGKVKGESKRDSYLKMVMNGKYGK